MRLESEVATEALPYVQLIGDLVSAPQLEEPKDSGFVAIGRREFKENLGSYRSIIESQGVLVPGDLELINLLDRSVSIRRVLGLVVTSRPSTSILHANLHLSVIQDAKRERGDDLPCQLLSSHKLKEVLKRSGIPLGVPFEFRFNQETPIGLETIDDIQQGEEELFEEVKDLGFAYSGEVASQLHYLIRLA